MTKQIDIVQSISNRFRDIARSIDRANAQVKRAAPTVTGSAVELATIRDAIAAGLLNAYKKLDELKADLAQISDQGEALDQTRSQLAQAAGQLGDALSESEAATYDQRNAQTLLNNLMIFIERHPPTIRQILMAVDEPILEEQAMEDLELYNKLERVVAHVAEKRYRKV